MEYRDERRNPWPWVAIIAGLLIFLAASWWIASASTRGDDIVLLDEEEEQPASRQPTQPGQPSTQQPSQQPGSRPATEEPTVTEQQPPVNIYVERTPERPEQRPVVVVVPRGDQPRATDGGQLSQVDVPAQFRYRGSSSEADDQAVSPRSEDLTDTGASVDGHAIYVQRDDDPPYDAVYVETEPGSEVYVRYTRRPSGRSG